MGVMATVSIVELVVRNAMQSDAFLVAAACCGGALAYYVAEPFFPKMDEPGAAMEHHHHHYGKKQDDLYPGQHGDHSSDHQGEVFFRSVHSDDVEGSEGSGVGPRLLGGGTAVILQRKAAGAAGAGAGGGAGSPGPAGGAGLPLPAATPSGGGAAGESSQHGGGLLTTRSGGLMQPAVVPAGAGPGPSDALSLLMDPSGHGSGGGAPTLASLGPGAGGGGGAVGSASCAKERARLSAARMLRLGLLMAVTMTLHNLPEGFAVAFSAFTDFGPIMALAIALHNIPEGVIVAAPIYAATGSRWRAVGIATASGLSEPLGALVSLLLLQPFFTMERLHYLLAFVGGVMLAVCAIELWPEGRNCRHDRAFAGGVVLGAAVMGWTLCVEG